MASWRRPETSGRSATGSIPTIIPCGSGHRIRGSWRRP
ncbi:MAG: CRISPR-associated protein Cas5 [Thermomicrobiales bacterium]